MVLMAKPKLKTKKQHEETDNAFLLKLVLYVIVGFQWVRLVNPGLTKQLPIPVGFIVGLLFAQYDRFKIDRKIEYTVLLVTMLIGFWSQVGVYVNVFK